MLYGMVTGVVPHEADAPYEVAALVLTAPLTRPSFHNQDISPALENVIMKALAKNADDRYPNARSFAEAVVAAIAEPKTLSVQAVGAWPRKTQRFDVGQPRRTAALADVPEARRTTQPNAQTMPQPRRSFVSGVGRRRLVLLAAAGVLLVSALCTGSALALVNGFQLAGLAPSNAVAFATATATSIPAPTETSQLPAGAATSTVSMSVSPTVQPSPTRPASPTPKPTATSTPTPVPTATPVPVLTLNTPVVMSLSGSTCLGSLRITNNSPQALGWSWQSISASHSVWSSFSFSFTNGGTYTLFSTKLPSNTSPGVAPGAAQVLYLKVSNCTHNLPTNVVMTDTHGNTYTFAMQTS